MRRIYESDALERDDDAPMHPREKKREHEPQSFRYIDSAAWSNRLVPHAIRRRAITVDIATPSGPFDQGEDIPFRVTMDNRLPMPRTL
jgi:hypothetical protein